MTKLSIDLVVGACVKGHAFWAQRLSIQDLNHFKLNITFSACDLMGLSNLTVFLKIRFNGQLFF